jgi:hypothetical protein
MKVVRIIRELYSEVTAVTPSTMRKMQPNSEPLLVVSTGSNASRTVSFQPSCVSPEVRAISAENPIESPIARETMIQVERRERNLVHSACSVAPNPGSVEAFEVKPMGDAVVMLILSRPFTREIAGHMLGECNVRGWGASGPELDTVVGQFHEGGLQARPLGGQLVQGNSVFEGDRANRGAVQAGDG